MAQPHPGEREDDNDRFVIFPGKHEDIWDCYKALQGNFWTAEEIDWHQDKIDYQKLPETDRKNLQTTLKTGISINYTLGRQLAKSLATESLFAEARFYFNQQLASLNSQSECLSTSLKYLNPNPFDGAEVLNLPTIKWLEKRFTSASYSETLVLFCLAQNLLFNKFFYQGSNFKQRYLMPGFVFCSELIAQDINLQTTGLLKLLVKEENQLPINKTEVLLLEALDQEKSTSSGFDSQYFQNLVERAAELLETLLQHAGSPDSAKNKNLIQKRITTLNSSENKKHNISRQTGF